MEHLQITVTKVPVVTVSTQREKYLTCFWSSQETEMADGEDWREYSRI